MSQESFTGQSRRRETRLSVKVSDKTARTLITVGGIGTIIAVTLIFAFLLWVVVPLFLGGELENERQMPLTTEEDFGPLVRAGIDEHQVLAWEWRAGGTLLVRSLVDGRLLVDRDRGLRAAFDVANLHAAEDARHLRSIWREVRREQVRS